MNLRQKLRRRVDSLIHASRNLGTEIPAEVRANPKVFTAPENGYLFYKPQPQERLGWKLFPNDAWQAEWPEKEVPQGSRIVEGVRSTVDYNIDWKDRIRILFSGRVQIISSTLLYAAKEGPWVSTDLKPTGTTAVAYVRPPWWLSRIPWRQIFCRHRAVTVLDSAANHPGAYCSFCERPMEFHPERRNYTAVPLNKIPT